jgi:hemolysin III
MATPKKINELQEIGRLLSKDGSVHVTNELINTETSLLGLCFAVLGTALLVSQSAVHHNIWAIVGFGIYGLTLISLFLSSTLHHGINGSPRVDRWLRTYDYVSVFLLIAGTITPLVLIRARNPIGWSVFGTVWLIAIVGIVVRTIYHQLPRFVTNTLYIALGWLAAVIVAANLDLSIGAIALLAGGGLIFSIGFVMFVSERPNIRPGIFGFHELWHCMVLAGTACQYFMIYLYILNR